MKPNFQLIVIIVCIALAIFGILVFSGTIPLGGSDANTGQGSVMLWGTFPSAVVSPILEDYNNAHPTYTVAYQQKSAETFDHDLLEALAAGNGPDMFFLPDELAYHYANKIFTVPYSSYSLANFKSSFAGAGEVFLNPNGIMAFPITIDPLVMYYNRSMLDANQIVYPPSTWDDLVAMVPQLVKKDQTNKILKAAAGLGQFSNVDHAKDILATLFMQSGSPIVAYQGGVLESALDTSNQSLGPVLNFYTSFADPSQNLYSWNKSFPSSASAFSSENLAIYFGYASELSALVNKNPNQNFLAAPMPQLKGANFKATKARVTGLAISRFSKNFNTAFLAASSLATSDFTARISAALNLAPARRDLLAQKPTDSYRPIFYSSALYARSFIDPSAADTNNIFRTMIESVLANTATPDDAVKDASSKLELLLLAK
jgi:ABC-type glycerol-3-phosphate transport system substrate-binding protein